MPAAFVAYINLTKLDIVSSKVRAGVHRMTVIDATAD